MKTIVILIIAILILDGLQPSLAKKKKKKQQKLVTAFVAADLKAKQNGALMNNG